MPELPDVTVYTERLTEMFSGQVLEDVRLGSPFLVRTASPPLSTLSGRRFLGAGRRGKRLVLGFEGGLFLVIHLMISGRLKLREPGATLPKKVGQAALDFPSATILLTEQSSHKRASFHLVEGRAAVERLHPGGLEPLEVSRDELAAALRSENRTLKRALTDQRLLSGIGNAYSDEILFFAELSPVRRTHSLSDDEVTRLHEAMRQTLTGWTQLLRRQVGSGFPEQVTAFRPEMAVHGRYGQPCRTCGAKIQRIRYANNETNYCARCQNGGRLLRDRSLSLLLRGDWPKTLEELEG